MFLCFCNIFAGSTSTRAGRQSLIRHVSSWLSE